MSTRIGICTRYDRNESAYVATILADWLQRHGFDVSMFIVPPSRVVSQGSRWDTHQHHGSRVQFTDWVTHRDIVIWTVLPQLVQLQYLATHGIKSYVIYDPYEPRCPQVMQLYQHAYNVLAINASCGMRCETETAIMRSTVLPLTPSSPKYQGIPVRAGQLPTVVWPIFDGDWSRYLTGLVPRMSTFLENTAGTHQLRIVMSGSKIPIAALNVFQTWQHRYKFVSLRTCRDIRWRELQYRDAHVMFWPTTIENAMLRGLQAYNNGLPIIGIMANPMRELLEVNPHMAISVRREECDRHGYAVAISCDTAIGDMLGRLLTVVQAPKIMADASDSVTKFITTRHKAFSSAMAKLFK